jgi:hypothetical protein
LATDDKEQYEELRKAHEHIVFTDSEKIPSMPRIEVPISFIRWRAILLLGSCPRTAQRPSSSPLEHFLANALYAGVITDRECSFKYITKEQIHTVSEEVKGATRKRGDRTPEEPELMRQLEELVVCTKLGLEKLTVNNMQSACRERNIPHTGKKFDMV